MNFEGAKNFILNKLSRELDPRLAYHSVGHTLDVHDSAIRIANLEKISEPDIILLRTAALFHDSGMLITYRGHEEASMKIMSEVLPGYNYSPEDIHRIESMIITTKLPQSADDKLSMILCDADLDYLGRDDYFFISHKLKYEWDLLDIYPTTLKQWYELQIKFVGSHQYFTKSSRLTRDKKKFSNLEQIREMFENENDRVK